VLLTIIRRCSLTVIIALLTLSCAKTEPSKPGQARNCEELVQIGRNIAELVLEEIEEKELTKKIIDLEHINSLLSDNLDPDYIDILIREKFMFGKKGETTYIVNNDS